MATASARPADLLQFERVAGEALAALRQPAVSLSWTLRGLRTDRYAGQFLPDIPDLGNEVLSLHDIGRFLAGWVGDVGRRFRAADTNRNGVVDERQLASVPRLGNGTFTVLRVNGRVIIDTGDGDDRVTVTSVPGGIRITVNGVEQVLTGVDASSVTIRVGSGNDRIVVDDTVAVHFTLEGQTGNDKLEGGAGDDTIRGGSGRDYIDGFSGDDVLDGGSGHDVVYAGDGNDVVTGGAGADYLEGGAGSDVVLGGDHRDVVSGGDGADRLDGQRGDDIIYAGAGSDWISDHSGATTAYAQAGDDLIDPGTEGGVIRVVNVDLTGLPGEGVVVIDPNVSPRFRQRMLQDLALLRSSPNGREMLMAFGRAPEDMRVVTLTEYPNDDNSFYSPGDRQIEQSRNITEAFDGTYTSQPDRLAWQEFPPIVVMFHEMAHHYDNALATTMQGSYNEPNGVQVPNAERQAVGLPVDSDGLYWTSEEIDPDHPFQVTENGLRREMGLPERPTYGPPARRP